MKTIHVLSIGNSFSQDAQRYLHELAAHEGVSIETVNLMIGGCSLERHYQNMLNEQKAYGLEANGRPISGFFVNLKEALLARSWDVITLQQASHFSYQEDTYQPFISRLAEYVRTFCPKAKLFLQETWGYETGSQRIQDHDFETYDEMFAKVKASYQKAAEEIKADGIFHSGTAFQYALHHGIPSIHRDTFHAKYGVGRFILALVWYQALTGNDILGVTFADFDEPVSEKEYRIAIEAAKYSISE